MVVDSRLTDPTVGSRKGKGSEEGRKIGRYEVVVNSKQ